MQRWRGLDAVPGSWGRCVVTIGTFDGVHRGHQAIVGQAVARARELGLPTVVLTFDPHPLEVLRPGSHPAVLSGPRLKADLLEALGVDVLLVLPFTLELSRQSADEFAHQVLVEHLHARHVLVGHNFHYGSGGKGTTETLAASGARFGFEVTSAPLEHSAGGTTWSSTYIRSLVAAGDVRSAAEALGREHRVDGLVVRGDQRGREIGYPTANLAPLQHSAVPADGIYAGHLVRGPGLAATRLPAAISIGTNPTFAGTERRVEAFVLDFTGDLYGEHVGISFVERLRETLRFDRVEDLVTQMDADVARTRALTGPGTA